LNAKFDDPTGTTAQYLRGDGSLATFPSLTGYVPYTGATTNVDLGEYQLRAGQLTLDTSPTGTAAVGTTRWNDTIGSSETTLKGGSVILKNGVDLVARIVNKVTPNTTLTKAAYQAVRVSGAQGQRLAVAFAQANNDANSADTIGLVTETIATNQEGFILTVGQIENINTTGSLQGETWVDGDVLYLSPTTAGAITKVKPTGNGHIVVIGYVEYAHANNGKIYVKVMNGWELDELHDVSIVSPANNEALIYESATALWKNKSIATALGYTPANAATTLTINGVTYDLSTSRTWTISAGISGSGASGQVAYWDGTTSQAGSANFLWDNTNSNLAIGAATTWQAGIGKLSVVNGATDAPILSLKNTDATKQVYYASYNDSNKSLQYIVYGSTAPGTLLGQFRANAAVILGYNTPSVLAIGNFENVPLVLGTNNAERLRIFGGGNIGIGTGTSDSGQRLQVQGTTLLNGNVTFSSATGMFWDATNSRLGIGTNAPAYDVELQRNKNSGTIHRITNTNNNASAYAAFELTTTSFASMFKHPTARTYKFILGDDLGFYNSTAGDISILNDFATGNIKFGAGGSSTAHMTLHNTGNLLLGSTSNSGERLQVTGNVKIVGSGATSATTALTVQNSSSSNLFTVRNDGLTTLTGTLQLDAIANFGGVGFYPSNNGGYAFGGGARALRYETVWGSFVSSPSAFAYNLFNSELGTAANISHTSMFGNFAPTSGTKVFQYLNISGTINQTGGANGITRGLYVNPTLTAAADFRAIETARGNVVFGNLPTSSAGLPTGAIWNDAGTIKIV
jgi:nitrogen fixation protein